MSELAARQERAEVPLLIVFGDLTRYTTTAERTPDEDLAEAMDAYYHLVSDAVAKTGGHLVKFIGDAFLAVFPEERVDEGAVALLALKQDVDASVSKRGWQSELIIKCHFGSAVAGPYGPEHRFDVIGSAVNTAARIASRGFALSAPAFRKLAPETRKHFKKHTPPITYIRQHDRH